MSRHAICYVASPGYLFQTVLSARQARAWAPSRTRVIIFCFGVAGDAERHAFARPLADAGIELVIVPPEALDGLPVTYGRLFLDRHLPDEIEEILYLDGDTQIVGALAPLLAAEPPRRGVLGSRDPMVFIRDSGSRLGKGIDGWWAASGIPENRRRDYLNSGMLRIARTDLPGLRADAIDFARSRPSMRFQDQDAINLALDGRAQPVSMAWNFPGFLIGTQLERLVSPVVLHFMSEPRPWEAVLPPWGERYFEPYRDLSARYPEVVPYWRRLSALARARYRLQQAYKHMVERPGYQSGGAARSLRALESDVAQL